MDEEDVGTLEVEENGDSARLKVEAWHSGTLLVSGKAQRGESLDLWEEAELTGSR